MTRPYAPRGPTRDRNKDCQRCGAACRSKYCSACGDIVRGEQRRDYERRRKGEVSNRRAVTGQATERKDDPVADA